MAFTTDGRIYFRVVSLTTGTRALFNLLIACVMADFAPLTVAYALDVTLSKTFLQALSALLIGACGCRRRCKVGISLITGYALSSLGTEPTRFRFYLD